MSAKFYFEFFFGFTKKYFNSCKNKKFQYFFILQKKFICEGIQNLFKKIK